MEFGCAGGIIGAMLVTGEQLEAEGTVTGAITWD